MLNNKTPNAVRILWRLSGAAIVISMLFVGAFLVGPLITEQSDSQRRLQMIESLRSTDHSVNVKLSQTMTEVESLRTEGQLHRDRVSLKNDETAFLHWANSQTNASGLLIRDFRPSSRDKQGEYETRAMILSAEGSYESVCLFLDKLRDCPQMIRVTSLEILPQNQDRTSFGATLSILLFTGTPQQAANPVSQG